jgi:predicted DNA-binding protein (MmcQ/YjbR family)
MNLENYYEYCLSKKKEEQTFSTLMRCFGFKVGAKIFALTSFKRNWDGVNKSDRRELRRIF